MIDEIDSHLNVESLRNVLNAGFKKGASVMRCEKTDEGYDPKPYPVYCARALSGINEKTLHETTRERTFGIDMIPQPRAQCEKFRLRKVKSDLQTLKNEIEKWVEQHRERIAEQYAVEDREYIDHFGPRTVDVTEPLAAIIEVVYGSHRELAGARTDLAIGISKTRKESETLREDREVFVKMRELLAESNELVGTATELASLCGLQGDDATSRMSRMLRRYNFKNRSIRRNGQPKYRYRLTRSKVSEILRLFGANEDD